MSHLPPPPGVRQTGNDIDLDIQHRQNTRTNRHYQVHYLPRFAVDIYRDFFTSWLVHFIFQSMTLKMLGIHVLFLGLFSNIASATPVNSLCHFEECNSIPESVPVKVADACRICGYRWGYIPEFVHCCHCSEKVFDFCMKSIWHLSAQENQRPY